MYLSAYHFDGDPIDLSAAYARLLSKSAPDALLLQAIAVGERGVTVIDACPDRATHEQFVSSPEFHGTLTKAGFPEPSIDVFGEVRHAYAQPSAFTLVGSRVL